MWYQQAHKSSQIILSAREQEMHVYTSSMHCVSVVFGGYLRVIPVHFKCMHYIHFNKERKARSLKLVSVTLKWSQTALVMEES